ncbi:anti-sigma factor [Cellulomonas sp. PhB143]|uniref:anti-sigma factor n=1 Tax=Cellulomonas sp. PhB143 TaxID=2485186 RepID=UPI000F46960D|nr:anti-sigma factor [Cellulomonas sp. PhB143]ROS79059.1 anti-sigma-K factor rskA [Cellulomonas sp. PhB143]
MQHVDPEVLALLALGERADDVASADERAHLEGCDACRAEVAQLAEVAATGRAVTDDDRPVDPPPEVWDRVRAELGISTPASPEPSTPAPPETRAVTPLRLRRPRRRRFSAGALAAAASAALVVGVGGGVLWGQGGGTPEPAPTGTSTGSAPTGEATVASATLQPLPSWKGATGEAQVEKAADGTRQVVVTVDAPASDDGFHEVWLIKHDLSGLVSLGVLDGGTGTFPVPDGLDLAQYSLVDVSEEGYDGNPAHSGDSIVRGGLTPA